MRAGVRIVIVRPEQPRNVGAALRACANFGAESLRVVTAEPWDDESLRQARVASAGAWDAAGGVRFDASLDDAVRGCGRVIGTSARPRGDASGPLGLAGLFDELPATVGTAALVFGPESQGLSAHDLARCHTWLRIPSLDTFPSLNLSHAVAVVLYEAARSRSAPVAAPKAIGEAAAPVEQQDRFVALAGMALARRRELPPARAAEVSARLRRMLLRAEPSAEDVAALYVLLRAFT